MNIKGRMKDEHVNEYKYGVYLIWYKNKIIYVGKDSNIRKGVRYYAHTNPSKQNDQIINKFMHELKHNNEEEWNKLEYDVFAIVDSKDAMNMLESHLIDYFKPKYNQIGATTKV